MHLKENNGQSTNSELHEYFGGKSFNVAYVLNCEGEEQVNFCIHTMLGGKMGEYLQQLNKENQFIS